jgi:hypothetical protein
MEEPKVRHMRCPADSPGVFRPRTYAYALHNIQKSMEPSKMSFRLLPFAFTLSPLASSL